MVNRGAYNRADSSFKRGLDYVLTVAPCLIAWLPAFSKVWTPFIATGLNNRATFGINRTIPQST